MGDKLHKKLSGAGLFDLFVTPFKKNGEAYQLIASLPLKSQNPTECETTLQRFSAIVAYCQYQPTLIDPFLDEVISRLVDMGGDGKAPIPLQNATFRFIYLITKMRGPKVVVRYLPNHIKHAELILAMLSQYAGEGTQVWEVRYVLLLWLSQVCINPIDLAKLDGDGDTDKQPIKDRVMAVAKNYLMQSDKTQDAACFLLSKFLTRTDTVPKHLPDFIDWAVTNLTHEKPALSQQKGILTSLALLFKHGRREDMQEYAKTVLECVLSLDAVMKDNAIIYKAGVKVIQRIGLTMLKPKVPKWRYKRGTRCLAENLALSNQSSNNATLTQTDTSDKSDTQDDCEDYDIPDELETIIDVLLSALKDDNFVVRMSAAKGVGRITSRLPEELADEVVGSILDLFDIYNVDGRWHGGCLALAELCRRGFLLPRRLPDVLPVVRQSLLYEEKRGTNTYGSLLRDAACYVYWSFARAFEPEDIGSHVYEIARGLVVTGLFDREINVRKCAVAAFQEHVGRQGCFPHGIEIVTTVDHFSCGNRRDAYLELSVYVAQFPEYTHEIIDHLTDFKMGHWDIAIRELTAEALEKLVPKAPEYFCKSVLPKLLPQTTDKDLTARHGSILCVSRIICALSAVAKLQEVSIGEYLGQECLNGVKDIATKIHDANLFKGLEGELMRRAVCILIEKSSVAGLPFHGDPILDLWENIFLECLTHMDPGIQECATMAVGTFYHQYYTDKDGAAIKDKQETVINKFLKGLKAPSEIARVGYFGAFGALPRCMLSGHVTAILHDLILATKFTKREEKWVNARCSAMKAIANVCDRVGTSDEPACCLTLSDIEEIYSCYLTAMQDYTIDGRGEVGSIVRETSLGGIKQLMTLVVNKDSTLLSASIVEEIFKKCIHQACEKKDKTRDCAGKVFAQLLHHMPNIPHIPHEKALKHIFTPEVIQDIRWSSPEETFHRFAEVLKLPSYTYSVLLGFTVCVGGLTEFLMKQSSPCLHAYFNGIAKDSKELSRIAQVLVDIFRDFQKIDRVSIPMLKMLDQLLVRGYFSVLEENENNTFAKELVTLVKTEISKSTDQQKLTAGADVLCGLLLFKGEVRKKCLSSLAIFLCHRYAQLRKYTAQKLLEVVESFDIVPADGLDEVVLLLGETIWENNDLAEIKQTRNALCELLEIPIPVALKKT